MSIEIYEDDDTTLVEDLVIPNVEAGADSDEVELHVWNNIGNGAGQARRNVRLIFQVEDPGAAGVYVSTGFPPVDELWVRAKVSGYDNTGDSSWSIQNTDWMPYGAFASMLLNTTIPANCAVYVKVKLRPPSGVSELTWRHAISVAADDHSAAVPAQLTDVDRGIFHGVGNYAESHLVRGGEVTATGTPDEFVNVAAAQVVYRGRLYGFVATAIELDQNDGSAAALTAPESYYAAISCNATGWHETKGTKAVSPTRPEIPAGEIPAPTPYVLVQYQAGTSVIETADLEGEGYYGRFSCVPGTGRQVKIHPHALGAIGGGTWRFATDVQPVDALTASDTSYIWQLANGTFDDTITEEPPETTAIGPLFEVDCDGSTVTAIRDRRPYAGKTKELVLKGAYPTASLPAFVDDLVVEDERLFIEVVAVRASDGGGGASGQSKFDVQINGTTIYTSSGTDDQRPVIAYNATGDDLVHRTGIHELTELRRGDVVSFHTVEDPTGGDPDRVECHLICRVP